MFSLVDMVEEKCNSLHLFTRQEMFFPFFGMGMSVG